MSGPMVPETISHYRIVRKLGSGGMGEVYLAEDLELSRLVALKVLPRGQESEERLRRFSREAHAASALSHPHVAHLYEIGHDKDVHFIAMEYVEGKPLDEYIGGRPLPNAEIVTFAIQIADALDEAHAKRIVHRDIKASNIMISPHGVKVLDFGLAKMGTSSGAPETDQDTAMKTGPGMLVGTPSYMAPEQALGREVDTRSDLFSLGVVLYQMCTGRLPFAGSTTIEMLQHVVESQPDAIARFNYGLPTELERIIRKCLEKQPERRYQNARDLSVDLRNFERDLSLKGATKSPIGQDRLQRRVAYLAVGVILLLGVLAALDSFARRRLATPGNRPIQLAVLPIANMTGDSGADYLSDGLTDGLINTLSQVPEVRVMARSTMFHYKDRKMTPSEVGKELNVDAVLACEMTKRGELLKVRAELVNSRDGSQIWGELYSGRLSSMSEIEREISDDISDNLRVKLSPREQKSRKPESGEAYRICLQGRYYWNKRTAEGLRKAIEYFERAAIHDPDYALAYVGLADSYVLLEQYAGVPNEETRDRARRAATRALDLDDSLAEAHTALASLYDTYDWNWVAAEKEYRRAIALSPSYATAHHWYARLLTRLGRHDGAIAEISRAQELDPLSPIINTAAANVYYYAGQYDRAIDEAQKTLELEPRFVLARVQLGLLHEAKGDYKEALAEFGRARTLATDSTSAAMAIAGLADAYALAGDHRKARELVSRLEQQYPSAPAVSYPIAAIYADLGERTQALDWLEKAYLSRSSYLGFVNQDPKFSALRADPRFVRLLQRIGLSTEPRRVDPSPSSGLQ